MEDKKVVLSVKDLNVKFTLRGQILHAIRGISLDVYQGESLAIVGESGSGKSVFVKCAMGLLDANGYIDGGSILYNGMDLTKFQTDKDWLKIRGKEIAMVFQDPMTSLNPLKTIGKQIQEAVELHQGLKGKDAYKAVLEVLSDVGIDDPERRYKQYPHEFSGGMRQRVVIAIAVACTGFVILFNVHGWGLSLCALGGVVTWMAYLLCGELGLGPYGANFIAAAVAAVYAEGMARARKYPVTSYQVISAVPLLPGAGIYYTMSLGLNGSTQLALQRGFATAGIAGSIAAAILLVSSVVRLFTAQRKK